MLVLARKRTMDDGRRESRMEAERNLKKATRENLMNDVQIKI